MKCKDQLEELHKFIYGMIYAVSAFVDDTNKGIIDGKKLINSLSARVLCA
jgi:hypothetical protein